MTPIPGSDNELAFWKEFVKTDRFEEWCKDEPNPELGEFMTKFIREHCPPGGRILDCGSGVVSILKGMGYKLTSTDVLGNEYRDLLPASIPQPLPFAAEDIPFRNVFDIVHMRNALDHCQNPAKAYEAMLRAVNSGGYLIIHGFENEATAEHYRGMHQWDICIEGESLVIRGRSSVDRFEGAKVARTWELDNNKNWLVWIKQK